jgi:hypothetical protein
MVNRMLLRTSLYESRYGFGSYKLLVNYWIEVVFSREMSE